ncbi:MAG: DUF2510 domain-containing protein [Acidimicrobiales bacterium]
MNSKLAAIPAAAVGLGVVTGGQWALAVGVAALCFVVGYVLALQNHKITGNYPWHMPPVFWAVLGALLPVIGFVVQSVACFTTAGPGRSLRMPSSEHRASHHDVVQQTDAQVTPGSWAPPSTQAPDGTWPQGSWPPVPSGQPGAPVYQGANWPSPLGPEAFQKPGPVPPGAWQPPIGPVAPVDAPPPLFGWYPDPTSRHEERYWDGRQWSSRVADGGVRADDPEGAV